MPLGNVTFVYYEDEGLGVQCAHCLELDVGGQGTTRAEATEDLQEAIQALVLASLEHGSSLEPGSPPAELEDLPDREEFLVQLVRLSSRRNCPEHKDVLFAPPPSRFDPRLVGCGIG